MLDFENCFVDWLLAVDLDNVFVYHFVVGSICYSEIDQPSAYEVWSYFNTEYMPFIAHFGGR